MASNVERISSLPTSLNQTASQGAPALSETRDHIVPTERSGEDYRLVIEKDEPTGSFIYKTLNRSTGEVVSQFPREEVLKLRDSPAYQAGRVIVTKA